MTLSANGNPASSLTDEEEVTLRRVAFGESEVKVMRARDLARLRTLRLIEDAKDGPQLTAAGRTVFDSLPKPIGRENPRGSESLLRQIEQRLDAPRRR
ncbi:MAG TPA: hypothetical protein VJQ81_04905 [Reyranella sp.]|jgi:hypothetical protein|nr:hypothetical protein [Reyranella sp.]